jgi:4-methyl-5(b-hydroxyethyl)-thiazole monophosphate biosynthesis
MNIYIYLYDGFAEFEMIFITTFLRKQNIVAVAQENRVYQGEGMLKHLPDITLSEIDPADVDLFVIPGGDPKEAYKDEDLASVLKKLNEKKKMISAICGGPFVLAKYGLLDGRKCTGGGTGLDLAETEVKELFKEAIVKNDGIVRDEHIITATGQNFLELACEIEMVLGVTPKEQMREDYKWWKNYNSKWEKALYSD